MSATAESALADFDQFSSCPPAADEQLRAAACHLQGLGIRAGGVVLFKAQQSGEALPLFWGCMALGAIFAPIDWQWPDYLVEKAAGSLKPAAIVTPAAELAGLAALFPGARAIALEDVAGWRCDGGTLPGPHDPGLPAAYLFTSGSTGTPKAVVLSRGALAHGAAVTLSSFGWRAGERLLNLPELHTMSGLRNALVAAPIGGLAWLASPPAERGNIFALVDLIRTSGCDHLVSGPALIKQLLLVAERVEPGSLDRLQAIYCTGAALNPAAVEAFHSRFGIPIINYYGLTETGGICISQSRDGWTAQDRSLGRAVGCTARLVPDADEGELQIRSPQLMSGYLADPERSQARFDGEWLRTGDVMRRDSDGNFHLLGRAELFIKTASTERVHPEEIEAVLEAHPDVLEAAVCGRADADQSERLVALVVLRAPEAAPAGLDARLARFVGERLGAARRPGEILFVEALPRLPGGKLARSALKDLLT